jgi:hypothetical protein
LQHVDCGLIFQTTNTMFFSFGFCNAIDIAAHRHELDGKGTPHHGFAGMQYLKAVCILIVEVFLLQDLPDFLG